MSFGSIQILWLLLFLPLLAAFFLWSWRVRQKLMTQFIQARLLSGLIAGVSPTRQKIQAALIISAVGFLIVAMARPQLGYYEEEVAQKGIDIVVAIDTSKSMLATDISPNRLARAKLAALDLMQQAKADRLGLVAFAGSAFLECPLTIDDAAFQQSVDALDVNTISDGGTSLSEAIDEALKAFKEGDNYKVLVLFTDGEDNDTGDAGAIEAAQRAAKAGLQIFTVGIGTAAGELLQIRDANGNLNYVRDEQGNVVKSHLNEGLLRQIAADTKGAYYSLSGANTMDALYQRSLAALPKSGSQEHLVRRPKERYHWFLAIAMLLLIAEIFFPERVSAEPSSPKEAPKNPLPPPSSTPPPIPTSATRGSWGEFRSVAFIVSLLFLPIAAKAEDSTNSQPVTVPMPNSPWHAMREYKAGKFLDAMHEYEMLIDTNNPDPRLAFNVGDAAYRATNYGVAATFFALAALTSPDVKLQQQAYYNMGNVLYRQGEQLEDLDAVQELWKQAMTNFQSAVTLNTNDVDAVHNLKYTKNNVALIDQMREAARLAKQEAESSVRQRNYHRALQIMEQAVQKNIAAKQFKEYVKRLKDIDEIATPNQH